MTFAIDFHALANAIGDAIVVCDAAGRITYWNPGAERMFGFAKTEAEGASLDIIIPEKQRKRHWDGWNVTMATGHTKYGNDTLRVPALTKSGANISIAFSVALLFGADGKVEGIASVMRDETERFNRDRALRKRVSELEAQLQGIATTSAAAPAEPAPSAPSGGCPAHAGGGGSH